MFLDFLKKLSNSKKNILNLFTVLSVRIWDIGKFWQILILKVL
jgi:hypothetical protein